MNITDVVIEFENEDANDYPLPSWSLAADQMGLLNWNPEKKSEDNLFDDYYKNKEAFGLHCMVGQNGFDINISVYQIFERPKRPELTQTVRKISEDTYETIDGYSHDFDDKFFIKDDARVLDANIYLGTLFGKDWRQYMSLISDMRFGNLRQIEQSEIARASAHERLATKLEEKLESMGFESNSTSHSYLRCFITMLVEYHHQYGNVGAHNKVGVQPPKPSEPT
jgi:hypothetical protein